MVSIVQKESYKLKHLPNSAEQFAWRYALPLHQVEQWLSETEWNYGDELNHQAFAKVVSELLTLGLISQEQSIGWEKKLF